MLRFSSAEAMLSVVKVYFILVPVASSPAESAFLNPGSTLSRRALCNCREDANTMGIFSGPFTTGSSTVRRRYAESFQGFLPGSLVLLQEEILLKMPSLKTVPVSVP